MKSKPSLMKFKPFMLLMVAASLLSLQACLLEGDDNENGNRNAVSNPSPFEGVWMMTERWAEAISPDTTIRDSLALDTADISERLFYVFFGQSLTMIEFNGYENEEQMSAHASHIQEVDDGRWYVQGADTIDIEVAGNVMLFARRISITYLPDSSEDSVTVSQAEGVRLVRYTGDFPPPEWFVPPVDTTEPNDSASLAVPLTTDSSAVEAYMVRGDVDWFSFEAVAGQAYFIRTHGNTDTYMTLFDTTGTAVLEENDDYEGGIEGSFGWNAGIEWESPASGTYYLEVTGYDDFEAGRYRITAQEIDSVSTEREDEGSGIPEGLGLPKRPHPLHPGK